VGDPEFDRVVLIRGPQPALVAALSAPLRERLIRAVRAGYRLNDGAVRISGWPERRSTKGLVAAVRSIVELAEKILDGLGEPVASGLLRNAASDPVPAVRKRNLEVLLEGFPGEPSRNGLRTMLGDALAENRRFAAEQILSRPDFSGLDTAARLTLAELSRTGAGQLSLSAPGSEGAVTIAGEAGAVSIADGSEKKR
jgi:hypothetical protein